MRAATTTFSSLGLSLKHHGAGAKDRFFEGALAAVQHLVLEPPDPAGTAGYSIPALLDDVFSDKVDSHLEQLRQALRPNKAGFLHPSSKKEFSATGEKLLAYLAVIHNPNCLHADGRINVSVTHATIRNLLGNGQLPLDSRAIQNMKLDAHDASLNVYGKSRRADVKLSGDFPSLTDFWVSLAKRSARETQGLEQLAAARAFVAKNGGEFHKRDGEVPALCMPMNLKKIPQLQPSHTVHDCSEIVLGDMHGNSLNMLHQLVATGYLRVIDEEKFKELAHFAQHAVPELSIQQLQKMAELELAIHDMRELNMSENTRRTELRNKADKTPEELQEYQLLHERYAGRTLNRLKIEHARLKFLHAQAQAPEAIAISNPYEFNQRFRQLLVDAVACPDAARGCKLTLGGDLVFDGGENDLFIYTILEFLHENDVDYDIIYSNHDAEAIAWFHSGCDLAAIEYRHSNGGVQAQRGMTETENGAPLGSMKGSKFQSSVALDAMCAQDPQFRDDVRRQMMRVHLAHLKLLSTSKEGGVLYTHTCVSNEMLQDMVQYAVPEVTESSTACQVRALNEWFRAVVNDKDLYFKETAWTGMDLTLRELSPLVQFVSYVGVDHEPHEAPVQIDLALPPDIKGVVHGHTKKMHGLGMTGEVDPQLDTYAKSHGLPNGWFQNPEQGSRYLSIDGGVGEKGGTPKGYRRYFAIPRDDARAGAHDPFVAGEIESLRV